jgi:SAM-dependent methyltransferase
LFGCQRCGARFDEIWSAPFLGGFDGRDVVALLEIATNARADNAYPSGATIRRLEDLLKKYHDAPDRAAFLRDEPDELVRASWFANRYNEWRYFTTITKGIQFAGRRVLDVGAGTGVDSYRLVAAGARVTALEYNPMLVRRGKEAVPEARWIGGIADALPFASDSFDIVCCNAALHHMRDVASSLEEMLRVLRPGGWLVTTGDPYRARHLGDDHEFAIFDRHPDVLQGINESIVPFTAFETVLEKHRRQLAIGLITGQLFPPQRSRHQRRRRRLRRLAGVAKEIRARLFGYSTTTLTAAVLDETAELQWWDFDRERDVLAGCSGSIALRCRKRRTITTARTPENGPVVSAGVYALLPGGLPTSSRHAGALRARVPGQRAVSGRAPNQV